MNKDYFCKNCAHNNNGWCPIKKMNGLKKITECLDKKIDVSLSNNEQSQYNESVTESTQEIDYAPYKVYGMREMFYIIQRQLYFMNNDDTVKTVKQIMVNLEKTLRINEEVQGIDTEYGIEEDIIEESKHISTQWLNEVGEYKSKEGK